MEHVIFLFCFDMKIFDLLCPIFKITFPYLEANPHSFSGHNAEAFDVNARGGRFLIKTSNEVKILLTKK